MDHRVEIEKADNGYVVLDCHEGKDGYERKRSVAESEEQALALAKAALKKGGKGKGRAVRNRPGHGDPMSSKGRSSKKSKGYKKA